MPSWVEDFLELYSDWMWQSFCVWKYPGVAIKSNWASYKPIHIDQSMVAHLANSVSGIFHRAGEDAKTRWHCSKLSFIIVLPVGSEELLKIPHP